MIEIPYLIVTSRNPDMYCNHCFVGLSAEWENHQEEDYNNFNDPCPECNKPIKYGTKDGKAYLVKGQ